MRLCFHRFALLGLPSALLFSPLPGAAQSGSPVHDSLRVFRLPSVEVIGRAEGALAGIPGAARVVDDEEVRATHPVSGSELLQRVTGVHVNEGEDALGLNLNVGVRGLNPRRSSRVLLLEDGIPIHLAPYSDPSAHYQPPAQALERIEILKGSGQVLHGPQTIGGVINYVRRPPPLVSGGRASLSGGNGGHRAAHVRLDRVRDGRSIGLDYSYRAAQGPRENWDHRIDDLNATAALDLGDQRLLLRAGAYRQDSRVGESGLTQQEFETAPRRHPFNNDVFHLERAVLHALLDTPLPGGALLTTAAYGQWLHRVSWRQASDSRDRFGTSRYLDRFSCPTDALGPEECGNQGRPRTYRFAGVEPRVTLPFSLGTVAAQGDMGVRVHVERVRRRRLQGDRPSARNGSLIQDNGIETTALSAFAQNQFRLGAWEVSPGLRFEHVRATNVNRMADQRERDDYSRWLPGLAAAVRLPRGVTLFGGVHRGFAPPRPADILEPRPGEGLVQVDPEVSRNQELGARGRWGGGVEFEATLFNIDFNNQIVPGDGTAGGPLLVNGGRTRHQGAEAWIRVGGGSGVPWGAFLDLAYTWLPVAEFADQRLSVVDDTTPIQGNRLPYAPAHLLNVGVGMRTLAGVEVRLQADHVGEHFGDDLNTRVASADGRRGLIPSSTVFTLGAEGTTGPLRVHLTVRNLLDSTHITDRLNGIMVGMPRTVNVGVDWEWGR
jgi:Fe(3+) dicitrate transport protein